MLSLGGDLESGQYMSLEENQLKTLKKQLKETFEKIARDKDVFDASRDSLEKHRIWQSTERALSAADDALKKYEFALSMLRGAAAQSMSKYQKDCDALKLDLQASRTKFF